MFLLNLHYLIAIALFQDLLLAMELTGNMGALKPSRTAPASQSKLKAIERT